MIAERNELTTVVGHEPWLGELVAWLAFGDTRDDKPRNWNVGSSAV